jgi:hypothetical protein
MLKGPIIAESIVGEINDRRRALAQNIIARQLLKTAMGIRMGNIKKQEQSDAVNKIKNLLRTKKEKELIKNLREEKPRTEAAKKIQDFFSFRRQKKKQKNKTK